MSGSERLIYDTMVRACEQGIVPDGCYGPDTCRWATAEETRRFGLRDTPLVHLDVGGKIDCYFTETRAAVVATKQ